MSWLELFVRPEILALNAYRSARSEAVGTDLVKLDANESAIPSYGQLTATYQLHRYPEPQPEQLKCKLANLYQVQMDQLLLTRGTDEGIDLLIRAFCKPYEDRVCIFPPTFGYYAVAANINAVDVLSCPLIQDKGFTLDWERLGAIQQVKLIFVCNPNNPTGNLLSLTDIETICRQFTKRALVIVDEAYIEFAASVSATTLLDQFDNLVILRTLSKAYALAGARIGTVIASPIIIGLLRKLLSPYPLPLPTVAAALDALSPVGLMHSQKRIKEVVQARDELWCELQKLPGLIAIYPSETNFILLQLKKSNQCYQTLKQQGILVRTRSDELPDALRITVGNASENQLLLVALGLRPALSPVVRRGYCQRRTKETDVLVELRLDNLGQAEIKTGIGFFDHMLEQIACHSRVSMLIQCVGDLQVDQHHTIEDVAICFGSALQQALGDKNGVQRYGFVLPMDDALAHVSIDLSGRGYSQCDAKFSIPMLGDFPTEMVSHFFHSVALSLGAAIHLQVRGKNTHHQVESCFKGFGRALKQALQVMDEVIPSSKGVL